MKETNRGSLIAGIGLICLGALFILFNIVPGLALKQPWPVIFLVVALGFYLPALVWPNARKGLAALFIPGTIFLMLGLIFLYNTLTRDLDIWAFAWLLIPGSVGLGMMLAAWVGKWEHTVWLVGTWIASISISLFAVFAAMFGKLGVRYFGAGLLLVGGLYLLIRSFLKKPASV